MDETVVWNTFAYTLNSVAKRMGAYLERVIEPGLAHMELRCLGRGLENSFTMMAWFLLLFYADVESALRYGMRLNVLLMSAESSPGTLSEQHLDKKNVYDTAVVVSSSLLQTLRPTS